MKIKFIVFFVASILGCALLSSAQANKILPFEAGAAKVNITPASDALPGDFTPSPTDVNDGYTRINDSLYTRALVFDNGSTSAALISVDNGMLGESIWKNVAERINKEIDIPVDNIILCATHTHSAPFLNALDDPIISAYISTIEDAIVKAAKKANSNMQPARIGFGTGASYLNVNRDLIDPETRRWTQGPNYEGVSDHTVYVVKVEAVSGELIGVLTNFAMHATMMFRSGAISAGIPGKVSNYIEDYYKNFHENDDVVALWSMGAAGDQNPVYYMSVLRSLQSEAAYERQAQMISSFGQIMGEEVIRVLQSTKRLDGEIGIYGAQKTVECPGRTRTNTGRQGVGGTYSEGEPVDIKLSFLQLGDIAFAGVNAEVYNLIAHRFKEESSMANIVFTTITNGASNSGYIPSDDAFGRETFQVLGSRLQPGYAETAIVNGLLELMDENK